MKKNFLNVFRKLQNIKKDKKKLCIPDLDLKLDLSKVPPVCIATIFAYSVEKDIDYDLIEENYIVDKEIVLNMISMLCKAKNEYLKKIIIIGKNHKEAYEIFKEKYFENIYDSDEFKTKMEENYTSFYVDLEDEYVYEVLSTLGVDIIVFNNSFNVYSKGDICFNTPINSTLFSLIMLADSYSLLISEYIIYIILGELVYNKNFELYDVIKYYESKFIQSLGTVRIFEEFLNMEEGNWYVFSKNICGILKKYGIEKIKDYDYEFAIKYLL